MKRVDLDKTDGQRESEVEVGKGKKENGMESGRQVTDERSRETTKQKE